MERSQTGADAGVAAIRPEHLFRDAAHFNGPWLHGFGLPLAWSPTRSAIPTGFALAHGRPAAVAVGRAERPSPPLDAADLRRRIASLMMLSVAAHVALYAA